jgi:hypothetical protein
MSMVSNLVSEKKIWADRSHPLRLGSLQFDWLISLEYRHGVADRNIIVAVISKVVIALLYAFGLTARHIRR